MADQTNYHPVTVMDGAKEGAVTTSAAANAAAHGKNPGLWARITNSLPFLQTKRGILVTIAAILVIVGGGLAGLAALRNRGGDGAGNGGTTSSNAITNDAVFYGQSPPFYPSRMSS